MYVTGEKDVSNGCKDVELLTDSCEISVGMSRSHTVSTIHYYYKAA